MVFQNDIIAGSAGASGYTIEQSIRFNDNDSGYLYRTPSSATNRRTWTLSYWIKRANLGGFMNTFDARLDGGNYAKFQFNSGDYLQLLVETGEAGASNLATTRLFRDPSAWYHIVLAVDTTQSTAADRVKIYVNGTQETSFISTGYPAQNYETFVNTTNGHALAGNFGGAAFLDGYMAEINFIDGTQAAASSFGETSSTTGQWVPVEYSGSYGTNGFYIKGENSSDLGNDSSGNNNDFTPGGLTSADQMSDSPTNNFCTWSSIDTGSGTLSNGNLVLAGTTDRSGTFGMTSGKWAWKITAAANGAFGVVQGGLTGTESTYSATSGEVLEFQFDVDAGTLKVSVDGGAYGSVSTGLTSGPYFPLAKAACSADFGQLGFSLDDADFQYLNTSNLPNPTIVDPSAYFQTTLYAGNGTAIGSGGKVVDQTENSTFKPDFVWIKNRSAADNHMLYDAVRGATKDLHSNTTNTEATDTEGLSTFDADGFTVGSNVEVNTNTENYVAWQWLANNTSGSSNTDGSITSTVAANTTAGFSICTLTGTGGASTFGHGLGVTPDFIIPIRRNNTDSRWTFHKSLGPTKGIPLNSTNTATTSVNFWNNTSPTSSIVNVGNTHNNSEDTYVFYCFAEVEGFSAFGSYEGNGSTNGPMVNLNFRPAFVMMKSIDSTSDWFMFDDKREGYNVDNDSLLANTTGAETTTDMVDLVSNGFKLRIATDPNVAETYIYAAFAENPFKTANAR